MKSDIFSVYVSLLRQTKPIASALPLNTELGAEHPVRLLRAQIPSIVKSVTRQLREKSFKTRQVNTGLNRSGILAKSLTKFLVCLNLELLLLTDQPLISGRGANQIASKLDLAKTRRVSLL